MKLSNPTGAINNTPSKNLNNTTMIIMTIITKAM
jgi:hypothetical protein